MKYLGYIIERRVFVGAFDIEIASYKITRASDGACIQTGMPSLYAAQRYIETRAR
jgi:hypothetical protein